MVSSQKGAFLSLFLALVLTLFVPGDLSFVGGPIVMLVYSVQPRVLYWAALCTGLLLDIIEMTPRLGILGLSCLLSSWWIYPFRIYFFKDSKITLPVMTFLFSLGTLVAKAMIALFLNLQIAYPAAIWFLLQPMIDAATSIAVFLLPLYLYEFYLARVKRLSWSLENRN